MLKERCLRGAFPVTPGPPPFVSHHLHTPSHSCRDPGLKLFPSEPQTPLGRRETLVAPFRPLHRKGSLSDPDGSGMLLFRGDTRDSQRMTAEKRGREQLPPCPLLCLCSSRPPGKMDSSLQSCWTRREQSLIREGVKC